ncbi:bifunctional phosphoribosyl-AMP cyclohydrolase/phosphoribosyl-ATP diphosphatase HisIE [Marinoscillum sp.]|uniref:bifunctional phosphoribosyl-AMP cyclohydrolase/phosphoribosyl-ATP diphosphatase HisIE n=1 Tax=Marinoscillum sp. TaxID=2024838 RepID=UPI003BAC4E06
MALDFQKGDGLIPAVIQDDQTGKVLMLGYMNEEALTQSRQSGKVTFFSRSKERLWVKGETSGNFLLVKEILEDCDGDTLLIKAEPKGPTCHTGSDTCFDEVNSNPITFLNQLRDIIEDRKKNPSDKSYTASLFKEGINKVAQKVGEEAVEVVIEAKDDNAELFLNESADLLFHLMALLSYKDFSLDDVVKILKSRHQAS